jgi:hypothetical protein
MRLGENPPRTVPRHQMEGKRRQGRPACTLQRALVVSSPHRATIYIATRCSLPAQSRVIRRGRRLLVRVRGGRGRGIVSAPAAPGRPGAADAGQARPARSAQRPKPLVVVVALPLGTARRSAVQSQAPAASQCSRRRAGRPWRPRGRAGDQRPQLGLGRSHGSDSLPMPAPASTSSRPGGQAGESSPDRAEQRLAVGEQVAAPPWPAHSMRLADHLRGRLLRPAKAEPPLSRCLWAVSDPPPPIRCRTTRPRHEQQYRTTIQCGHGIVGGDLMGGVGHVLGGPPRRRDWSRSSWHATRLPRSVRVARPGGGGHPASKGAARAPPPGAPVACRVRPF